MMSKHIGFKAITGITLLSHRNHTTITYIYNILYNIYIHTVDTVIVNISGVLSQITHNDRRFRQLIFSYLPSFCWSTFVIPFRLLSKTRVIRA